MNIIYKVRDMFVKNDIYPDIYITNELAIFTINNIPKSVQICNLFNNFNKKYINNIKIFIYNLLLNNTTEYSVIDIKELIEKNKIINKEIILVENKNLYGNIWITLYKPKKTEKAVIPKSLTIFTGNKDTIKEYKDLLLEDLKSINKILE